MSSQNGSLQSTQVTASKSPKIMFFQMATLTFKLIRDIVMVNVHAELQVHISNSSAVRALTDGQTDTQAGPILYPRPLTREGITLKQDRIGNKKMLYFHSVIDVVL